MLDHERLDVYRCSIQFLAAAFRTIGRLPRGHAALADQLRRASTSIPLNIAEAVGKISAPDPAHFYAIARGSAMECAAILDVAGLLGVAAADVAHGKELLVRIVSMLTMMCR
jgi:four helix bundle protein